MERQGMHMEIWWGNLFGSGYLEGDGRMTLRWTLGKYI
jgi:hypothetical protein